MKKKKNKPGVYHDNVYSISKCNSSLQKMDRTLSTIQHIIQRSRERKALPLAPTEADNCYLSGRSNEYQDMSQLKSVSLKSQDNSF